MNQRIKTALLIMGIALIGVGFFYAFQQGLLNPSADVATQTTTTNLTTSADLQKGTFDTTELKNGMIQLQAAQ